MARERRISLLLVGIVLFALAGAAVLPLTVDSPSPVGLLGYRTIFLGLLLAPALAFALLYGLRWRVQRGALWRRGVALGLSVTALGHLLFGVIVFIIPIFAWSAGWISASSEEVQQWLFGIFAMSMLSFGYAYATFPCGLIAGIAFEWLEGRVSPSPGSV